jgi:hypothetical protein
MLEYLYKGRRISGERVIIGQGDDAEIRLPNRGPFEDGRLAVIREVGGHPCLIRIDADASIQVDGEQVKGFLPLKEGAVVSIDGEDIHCIRAQAGTENALMKRRMGMLTAVISAVAAVFLGMIVWSFFGKGIVAGDADRFASSVYHIQTDSIYLQSRSDDGYETLAVLQTAYVGTGFLTEDGRFVTARHVAEPWMNPVDTLLVEWSTLVENTNRKVRSDSLRLVSHLTAMNTEGAVLRFRTDTARLDRSRDRLYNAGTRQEPRWKRSIVGVFRDFDCELGDWTWFRTGSKGKVVTASPRQLAGLRRGQPLLFIGCKADIRQERLSLNPTRGELKQPPQWQDRAHATCLYHDSSFDNGDSGGPVLSRIHGRILAVGIISRKDPQREILSGWSVPITEISHGKN